MLLVGGGRGKGEEAVYLRDRWESRGVVRRCDWCRVGEAALRQLERLHLHELGSGGGRHATTSNWLARAFNF
jgi:hypothetical protein